jgi:hypothetical protein
MGNQIVNTHHDEDLFLDLIFPFSSFSSLEKIAFLFITIIFPSDTFKEQKEKTKKESCIFNFVSTHKRINRTNKNKKEKKDDNNYVS